MISGRTGATAVARRAAGVVFGVFAVNGFVFASWISRLPAVRDALDLSPAQMGFVLLVGAGGSLIALPLTGALVQRIGSAATTRGGAVLAALGFGGVALGLLEGDTVVVAAALFVATMGLGAWDVAMNLQGTVVERALGRAVMPRFHAGFSLGAVAGAGAGALAAGADLPVHVQVVATVVAAVAAVVALVVRYLPDPSLRTPLDRSLEPRARHRTFGAWLEPRTLLIGLMVLAAALTEGSANDWLALAVVDGFGSSDAVGAVVFGVFVVSMTAMRFAGTRLLDRLGRVAVLRLCAGLGLAGLLVFALAPALPLAAVGAVAWGLGAALGFPVGMSAAADDPARAAGRVSVVASIGYVAFLAGPPLIGLLADQVGYRPALLVIAGPLALSIVLASVAAERTTTGQDVQDAPMRSARV